MVDEFPTSLNSNGEDFLFCKQNYIWLEQPRARCDDIKNHTRNGCKKIANPKSDYVTHEVSGKRKCCFVPLPLTNKRTLRTFNTCSHLRWQYMYMVVYIIYLLIFMITAQILVLLSMLWWNSWSITLEMYEKLSKRQFS